MDQQAHETGTSTDVDASEDAPCPTTAPGPCRTADQTQALRIRRTDEGYRAIDLLVTMGRTDDDSSEHEEARAELNELERGLASLSAQELRDYIWGLTQGAADFIRDL